MSQIPLIQIPLKLTDEVDFKEPFSQYIESQYSEDPSKYQTEISLLSKLRQDIAGAGTDLPGRDILYRYYGQLELLDLRFPIDEKNVKITFTWYDAFTQEGISQFSLAYEKACIIFNIAATCSSIASSQNRFEPSGLKMAYNYFQAAAGLFGYINDNFLHAPSADMSRECIKAISDLMLGQAQECFIEKVITEKKRGNLVAKLASHLAFVYTSVVEGFNSEEVREFIPRAWVDLIKIKARFFQGVSHYHYSFKLETDGKYGECVSHLTRAEQLAKESLKLSSSYGGGMLDSLITKIAKTVDGEDADGKDYSAIITDVCKTFIALITERKNGCVKDNDLIYHDVVPDIGSLPAIDKNNVTKATNFASICTNGQAEISNIIGPDIFQKLVPLSVHESGSLYSEEKAKILRSEFSKVETADGDLQATLESLNIMPLINKVKNSGLSEPLPNDLVKMANDVRTGDSAVELLSVVDGFKSRIKEVLDEGGMLLDKELSDCEGMRTQYMNLWTQAPSSHLTATMRAELRNNRESFEKALATDSSLLNKLNVVKSITDLLSLPVDQIESIFAVKVATEDKPSSVSLIDDSDGVGVVGEHAIIQRFEGMLSRLKLLKKERNEFVLDLKTKVHSDDISSLLLLNKNKEKQVFDAELSKFKSHQARISNNIQTQTQVLQELTAELEKFLATSTTVKTLNIKEQKKYSVQKEWKRGYDTWKEVMDGLRNGVQFYSELSDIVDTTRGKIVSFVNKRTEERDALLKSIRGSQAEVGQQALRDQLNRLAVSSSSTSSTQYPSVSTPYHGSLVSPAYQPSLQRPIAPTTNHQQGLHQAYQPSLQRPITPITNHQQQQGLHQAYQPSLQSPTTNYQQQQGQHQAYSAPSPTSSYPAQQHYRPQHAYPPQQPTNYNPSYQGIQSHQQYGQSAAPPAGLYSSIGNQPTPGYHAQQHYRPQQAHSQPPPSETYHYGQPVTTHQNHGALSGLYGNQPPPQQYQHQNPPPPQYDQFGRPIQNNRSLLD